MPRTIAPDARLDVARHAARLFLRHGVAGTSGEDIAEASGISKRTLWRYFRTKESCVEPLFASMSQHLATKLANWPHEQNIEDFLRINYDLETIDAQELQDSILVVQLVAQLEEEPALRAAWLMSTQITEGLLADVIADRLGRSSGEFEVKLCAATVGAAMRIVDETVSRGAIKYGQTPTTAEINDRLAQAIRNASTLPFCDPIRPRAYAE